MRYGPRKIAGAVALLAFVLFASFAGVDYLKRQNAQVIKQISGEVDGLLSSSRVPVRSRSWLMAEKLQMGTASLQAMLAGINNPVERLNMANGIATDLIYYGRQQPADQILAGLSLADSLLTVFSPESISGAEWPGVLKELNDHSESLELAYYYNPTGEIEALRTTNGQRSAAWVQFILTEQPQNFDDIDDLNVTIEFAMMHNSLSPESIRNLLQHLSPFEGNVTGWVSSRFDKNRICAKGFFGYGFKYNGLYQELAYMYAALGDHQHALQCVDTLLKNNQSYFQNDYASVPDNASHIAFYYFRYGQHAALDAFVKGYCSRKHIQEHEFYAFLLGRSKLYEFATTSMDMDPRYGHNLNVALDYSTEEQIHYFFEKYRTAIQSLKDAEEQKFLRAVSYKDEGIIQLRRLDVQENESRKSEFIPLFDRALELYRTVDPDFLNTRVSMVELTNNDNILIERKFLFLFPDIRTPFHPNEPRLFHFFYTSSCFLKYIVGNHLVAELYPSRVEYRYLDLFFRDYGQVMDQPAYQVSNFIDHHTLAGLERQVNPSLATQAGNLNAMYLYLIKESGERSEPDSVVYYGKKVLPDNLKSLFQNSFNADQGFRLVAESVTALFGYHASDEAERIVAVFVNPINRSSLYAYAANELMRRGRVPTEVKYLTDSSLNQLTKITDINTGQPNRVVLAQALALEGNMEEAYRVIKNLNAKWFAMMQMCRSLAFRGELYKAVDNMPDNLSDADACLFLWNILDGYNEGQGDPGKEWASYRANGEFSLNHIINYVND